VARKEEDWQKREILRGDVPRLYQGLAGQWLLLEVVEEGEDGSPKKLRLHGHDENKDALRELMLERDDWSWKRRFLLVRADPDRCELG
jgi:hypothetical protein